MFQRICILLLAVALAACEPLGPIPGRSLAGNATAAPADWALLDDQEVVQLETRGPYSINIWIVGLGAHCYVAASRGPSTKWAERISSDRHVTLRVGDNLYLLAANVVDDTAELDRVTVAFKQKYDLDSAEDFPEAIVFRLDPR